MELKKALPERNRVGGEAVTGFTTVELITVIIILSVMAAVVVPRMAGQSTYDSRFFIDDYIHALRFARQFAVTKGCFTQVTLTTAGYALAREDDCLASSLAFNTAIARPDDDTEDYVSSITPPAGTAAATVVFSPAGRAGTVAGTFSAFAPTLTVNFGTGTAVVYGESGFVREI